MAGSAPLSRGLRAGQAWFHRLDDGRLQCDLCPRDCKLKEGQHGACLIRERHGDAIELTSWGRSSGFCVDPIEKKPLNHFYPGSRVLSFGTAGCNLACKFCQNWDISHSKELDRLQDQANPQQLARLAGELGCHSVAFTYNDPVIFAEYALDVADACHAQGIQTVAVTAGYINPGPRQLFYAAMDAANIDLKGFSEAFYKQYCGARLAPVLDTLAYVHHETACWLEITTLLIPQANDNPDELRQLCQWIARELGPEVPLHFTAFHPDYRLTDRCSTPASTLELAQQIGHDCGLHYVYTGNVHTRDGGTTHCPGCHSVVIERCGYSITAYQLDEHGHCLACGTALPGRFKPYTGCFGNRRIPLRVHP
ncbi:AmmeMemoRadiSam system radical SAM enzyme [Chitinilyticum piscinae]|uniref:AmmeMemoRadiSam system radical SAM enzyme n=1 Tax=Chitinilyticum piscinae TaxID=2866724 RepID=A0A8J7K272_9NEIS|nr:AmmeMemoRadiSam system radical SAM enzyme [Chitinilyticum piscinae]MBE9609637.1 AmmeMemoRadiSam system radical SAM enzyme [Chitinilyticum piscinae]